MQGISIVPANESKNLKGSYENEFFSLVFLLTNETKHEKFNFHKECVRCIIKE